MADQKSETLPALPSVALPADITLSSPELVKLAREVAMDIHALPVILGRYSITEEQYAVIAGHPHFKQMLDAMRIEWNSPISTQERMKIEAAIILEDALPSIGARMSKDKESLDHVVKAGQLFAKLAGVDQDKGGGNSGEKFTININLGADTKLSFEQDVTPTPPSGSAKEIRALPKGEGDPPAV